MKTWYRFIIVLILLVALPVHAQQAAAAEPTALDKLVTEIKISSMQLGAAIKNSRVKGILDPGIRGMAQQWHAQLILSTEQLRNMGVDLQPHLEYLKDVVASGRNIPSLVSNLAAGSDDPTSWRYEFYVSGREDNKSQFDQETNGKCRAIYDAPCRTVLEQVFTAVNTYKSAYKEYSTGKVLKTLELYSDQWADYFSKARSQTFLELAVNSFLYRDEVVQDSFVAPPPKQVILLHPSLLLEYVDHAQDGRQLSEALALEWIGINWWDKRSPIGHPAGISLISVYADRAEVDDLGLGIMLHVNNNYSFGVTWRDGDPGYFFTLDLLKLFEDKQSNFRKYKDKIDKVLQ